MSVVDWVWLQSVLGYGCRRFHAVLDRFLDAHTVFTSRNSEQIRALKLPVQVMNRLREPDRYATAQKTVEKCNANGIRIIPYDSPEYPPLLRNIEDPPVVLYATGILPDFTKLCCVAMVGTRRATEYGIRAAFSLSYRLARSGCLPVSGIADGIDQASHFGAMAAKTPTVAILPSGHGNQYNSRRQPLLDAVLANGGCLLSELPPGAFLQQNTFPLRNRLLSGVSEATVVIQAPGHSGALLTAGSALQQGRELFVVPGLPGDDAFAGSYTLIRDGATPVFHARDIIDALPDIYSLDAARAFSEDGALSAAYRRAYHNSGNMKPSEHKTTYASKEPKKTTPNKKREPAPSLSNTKKETVQKFPNEERELPPDLPKTAAEVYRAIPADGGYVDMLVERTGLDSSKVLSAITELEIYGLIDPAPGGKYIPL